MSDKRLNTRAAGIVAIAVMCSRLLGLARELIFASLFGAGRGMDAFFTAFKAPNLLRDLFAEGALSTAFITVFSKKITTEGDGSAWALASKMATLAVVFMSAVSLAGVIFAEPLIFVLAPGFDAEKAAFTILLTRIMYPFILLVSLAALAMGMLNAKNIFGVPAMASSFFNIGSIAGGVFFGWWIDPTFGEKALIGLALGTLVGGLLQLAVQLPSLWKVGFRFHPDFKWRDAGVKLVIGLMIPSIIAASAVQVNVMVNAIFASYLQDGAVSWLQYAFRLLQLPIGVFGVAIATVTLPLISRLAATTVGPDFRQALGRALRLAIFLTLPAAAGLAMLAVPIIGLIYQRGSFTAEATLRTGEALQLYAIGLVGYSCIKVLSPAFYAIDRRWTPMLVSFVSIALNVGMNYLFIFKLGMGHRGLALSTAISATLNFLALFLLMRRFAGGLESLHFLFTVIKCAVATAALAAVCYFGGQYAHSWLIEGGLLHRGLALFAIIGVAGLTYLIVCWILRVQEIHDATTVVRRKFLSLRSKK